MKKILAILGLVFLIGLGIVGGASAYTILDNPNDAIEGTQGQFESYRIEVDRTTTQLNIGLITNYRPPLTVGTWTTWYADLALDFGGDGSYDYGFSLKKYSGGVNDVGLYSVAAWYSSADHKIMDSTSGSYIYGSSNWVTVESGTEIGNYDFALKDIGTDLYEISIALNLSDLPSFSVLGLHWGTATCANDIVEGKVEFPVPEPATMLLLGSGLIGLAGFGRNKLLKK